MRKIHTIYWAMALLLLAASCSEDPEVIRFNDNYTPKSPIKGERDPRPPIDLLTTYSFFKESEIQLPINRIINIDGSLSIKEDIKNVDILVKTTIPVATAATIEIVKITAEDVDLYPKIIKGAILELPADAYSLANSTLNFNKGDKEAGKTTISFNKEIFLKLDETKQYVIPLKMKVTGIETEIVNHFVLTVSLKDVEALPEGDNVTVAESVPDGTTLNQSAITVNSNYAQSSLYKLTDGKLNYYQNWWVASNSDTWLSIAPKGIVRIKAVLLKTNSYDTKTLKSVKVAVSQNGGDTYVEQGSVNFDEGTSTAIIVFEVPVKINEVKIYNFIGQQNWIDIHEVELVAE